MDKQNHNNDNWIDDILGPQEPSDQLGPDEAAIRSAGLTHPDDWELEKILAEDWSEPEEAVQNDEPAVESAPEEVPNDDKPPKKHKLFNFQGLPHLFSTLIWILLIVVVGFSLGRILWVCCAEVMAFGKQDHKVTVTISAEDNISQVAQKLDNAKLIRYPGLFKFFATATGKDENIGAGTYTLNATLDYNAMINAMSYSGSREIVEIMFPEGYTCAQIFALLEEKKVCTVADLEKYAASGELADYWFLDGVERGSKYCLEGYLAPDTYKFYTGDEPRRVLEKFLNEFDDRFTDIMKEDFETLQYNHMVKMSNEGYSNDYINTHKLTVHNVLTVASMVEKETSSTSESFDIASVFYNRLAAGDTLGSDATVHYAIGDYFIEKAELSAADLAVDSPYNTRKNTGLPPGPICNSGTYALYAALDPNDTSYKFFVYDSEAGEHLFSNTYDEHLSKVQELGLG